MESGRSPSGANTMPALRCLAFALTLASSLSAQVPFGASWVWSSAPPDEPADRAWVAAESTLARAPTNAQLGVAADTHARIFLNGQFLEAADDWHAPLLRDVTHELVAGRNVLAFAARNDGGPAGLLAFVLADGAPVFRTGAETRVFTETPPDWPTPAGRPPATVVGSYGALPWGPLSWNASRPLLPAEGFTCEEVGSGFGSLIALTLSPEGEPVVSVESGGLLVLHDADGDG